MANSNGPDLDNGDKEYNGHNEDKKYVLPKYL
jgi:hypothetical protein